MSLNRSGENVRSGPTPAQEPTGRRLDTKILHDKIGKRVIQTGEAERSQCLSSQTGSSPHLTGRQVSGIRDIYPK